MKIIKVELLNKVCGNRIVNVTYKNFWGKVKTRKAFCPPCWDTYRWMDNECNCGSQHLGAIHIIVSSGLQSFTIDNDLEDKEKKEKQLSAKLPQIYEECVKPNKTQDITPINNN